MSRGLLLQRLRLLDFAMLIPAPMPLVLQQEPFDDRNWIYEIKHDGFRALPVIEHGHCRFFSRKNISWLATRTCGKHWSRK